MVRMRMRRIRRGFTLLELMIVVAIVGILAAVAVPNFLGVTTEAKVARIQSDLSTIGSAVEMYYVKKGAYPSSIDQLVSTSADGKNGYLRSEPAPPVEGAAYALNSTTGEVTFAFEGVTYSSFGTSSKAP